MSDITRPDDSAVGELVHDADALKLRRTNCALCGAFLPEGDQVKCSRCGVEVERRRRGWLGRMPQAERPAHLRYSRLGVHDHHLNAAHNDVEREHARRRPQDCYDDERCWWDGGLDA